MCKMRSRNATRASDTVQAQRAIHIAFYDPQGFVGNQCSYSMASKLHTELILASGDGVRLTVRPQISWSQLTKRLCHYIGFHPSIHCLNIPKAPLVLAGL